MRWFGENWNALICYETEHTDTPTWGDCGFCQKRIEEDDRGLLLPQYNPGRSSSHTPYHLECFLEMVGVKENGLSGRRPAR